MADSFIDIIDSFLITLEKERNFSLHTIKAYKNDLTRFIAAGNDYHKFQTIDRVLCF